MVTIGAPLKLEAAEAMPASGAGPPVAVRASAANAAQNAASTTRRDRFVFMTLTPSARRLALCHGDISPRPSHPCESLGWTPGRQPAGEHRGAAGSAGALTDRG